LQQQLQPETKKGRRFFSTNPQPKEIAMNIQMIALNQLVVSPANVRKTGAKTRIEGLAANIAAIGLLQNLQVRPTENGAYEVVAGSRRMAALKLLAKQKALAKDEPIICNVLGSGEDPVEISLAENEMREAMHPADQFAAFKQRVDAGQPVEDIAARFCESAPKWDPSPNRP
jgi:ParB family chromosome partitioning protein